MRRILLWSILLFVLQWNDASRAQELPTDTSLFRVPPSTTYFNADTVAINKILDSAKKKIFQNPTLARRYFVEALSESRSIGFRTGMVKALNGLASLALFNGHYNEATRHYQEALHYSDGVPLSIVSDTYNGLSALHMYKSQYTHGVWFLYKYLELAETSTEANPPLARTYNNLSAIWRILRDEEKQLEYTILAEKAALKEQDTHTLSTILFRKGLFIQDTNLALGIAYHRKALSMARKNRDNHTILASMLNLGRAYRHAGDSNIAREYLHAADSMLQVVEENPFNKISFYNSLGESYYLLGLNAEAEQNALKALSLAKSLNTQAYLIRTYNLLTHIYDNTNEFQKAFKSQKEYLALRDSLTGEQTIQATHLVQLKYLNAKKDRELALHQLAIAEYNSALLRKNILIGGIVAAILMLFTGIWIAYRNIKAKSRIQQEVIRSLEREREIEQMKAIMQGEDRESIRIGQELHDGIGSMLSVVKMNLSMIPQQYQELARSQQYQDILKLLDKASTDLRETAHNLMLDSLLQGGLDEAVQHYCEKNSAKHNINIQFLSYGQAPSNLSNEFQRSAYRIVRELIAYAIRQKNVNLVVVQFNWLDGMLSIILEDDALIDSAKRGIHPVQNDTSVRSRIEALNGRVDIDYGHDRGHTIDIEFDIRQHVTIP